MKKICLLIMVALFNFEAYAQLAPAPQPLEDFKTIGTSKYEVRYSFKFKNHHTDSQYIEDTRVVQIGDAIVKDYSDVIYHLIHWLQSTSGKAYRQVQILMSLCLARYSIIIKRRK